MSNIKTSLNDFLNESTQNFDSFKINVKYTSGACDIDSKNLLTDALQKVNGGYGNYVTLDRFSFKYKPKNSNVKLEVISSTYDKVSYLVKYNIDLDEHDERDDENTIFKYVEETIKQITHYSYRSVYSMDKRQRTDISVISVEKID